MLTMNKSSTVYLFSLYWAVDYTFELYFRTQGYHDATSGREGGG